MCDSYQAYDLVRLRNCLLRLFIDLKVVEAFCMSYCINTMQYVGQEGEVHFISRSQIFEVH
jgi:hypothetical protein